MSGKPLERKRPPSRSIYRKLRVVVAVANSAPTESLSMLTTAVNRAGELDFTRFQLHEDGGVGLVPCSRKAIERIVALAAELGLITAFGHPTQSGRRANTADEFDPVITAAVDGCLSRMGLPIEMIENEILSLFREAGPDLPTADALSVRLANRTGNDGVAYREKVQVFIRLLGATGRLHYSSRRIYLPTSGP